MNVLDCMNTLERRRARGSGAMFQPAVMPESYVPEGEKPAVPPVDTSGLDARGTFPRVQDAASNANKAAAYANQLTALVVQVAPAQAQTLQQAQAYVSDMEQMVARIQAGLTWLDAAAAGYHNATVPAFNNVKLLTDRAAQAAALAQQYVNQNQLDNARVAVEQSKQLQAIANDLGAAVQQALDASSAAVAAWNQLTAAADAAIARIKTSVYAGAYRDQQQLFDQMNTVARKLLDQQNDPVASFLNTFGKIAGGGLGLVAVLVAAALAWSAMKHR